VASSDAAAVGVNNDGLLPRSSRGGAHDADPASLLASQVESRSSSDDGQSTRRVHRVSDTATHRARCNTTFSCHRIVVYLLSWPPSTHYVRLLCLLRRSRIRPPNCEWILV